MSNVTIDVAEFTQALRLSTVFSTSGITNVIISVQEDGSVSIANYATQKGGAKYTLRCEVEHGFQPITAAFNTRYLLDALGATNEEKVTLQISGRSTPLVISTGKVEYTQLVMPIRLEA
jgi:DNA polymerase III sliding clamp (beta) subunit (PCNA family)